MSLRAKSSRVLLVVLALGAGTSFAVHRFAGYPHLLAAIVLDVAIGGLMLLVLVRSLRRTVIRPVAALSAAVRDVARGADLSRRVPATGADELVLLADDVNRMLAGLERADRDLRTAKEEAEEASRAKSRFLATMSHEIRTPMNGIIGMTTWLLDTPLDTDQREAAETVRTSAEMLLTLLNDILDFSKGEAGRIDLEETDFDLRTVLESVLEVVAARAHEKGLELVCEADPDVPARLRGDPGRLQQVLLNFAGNAVKFTERGEVTVRASIEDRGAGADRVAVRFTVADTGIGIAPDRLDLLFVPFAQAEASTSRRFGGTGLGLAIAKQLAERMGGRVGVESAEGRGSTFWFTALLARAAAGATDASPAPPVASGLRVLVADGNASSRRALAAALSAWGCRPAEAVDAAAAVAALREAAAAGEPFRVALVDERLEDAPGKGGDGKAGGEAVGREIRADRALDATALVLLTRFGRRRADAARRAEAGFPAHVTKPVRLPQLAAVLAAVAEGAAAPSAAPAPEATRAPERRPARRLRVLLAEDNAVNQRVARKFLERMGHEVTAVEDGREAVRTWRAAAPDRPFDVVLMDCRMPEVDGYEATAEIRRFEALEPSSKRTRIVALTANAMSGDRERCVEAGMDDFVPKPISFERLEEALDGAGERAATARP